MRWSFGLHRDAGDDVEMKWRRLNAQVADSNPALDYRFVKLLSHFFGNGSELIGFCTDGTDCVAGAVVQPLGRGSWTMFVPGQACLTPLLISPDVSAERVLLNMQKSLPGYCWRLKMPKVDPDAQPVSQIVALSRTDVDIYGTTYDVMLNQTFESYWANCSKSVRRGIRKSLEFAASRGVKLELHTSNGRDPQAEAVELHGRLESTGWKGEAGTAVHKDNIQGQFYTALLNEFSVSSGALTARLYLDGQLGASLLCIACGERIVVLKTAFEHEFSDIGPGRLLDYFYLKELCGLGKYRVADMYTRASKSDLSWSTNKREWYDIDLYRSELIWNAVKAANFMKSKLRRLLDNESLREKSGIT